jgi:hypothetical protein
MPVTPMVVLQIRPMPVAWRTTHSASRNPISEPPIVMMRRTSRAT